MKVRPVLLHSARNAAILVMLGSCDQPTTDAIALAAAREERQPIVVDSIFPIEEEIRRFRATIDHEATALTGGEPSREALVRRFVTALETSDTAAFREMTLSRSEYAYLYYPYTRFTSRPYELSPALVWFQIQNYGSKGITRAFRRYGGEPLEYVSHECEPEPEIEGENWIWHGCVLRRVEADGDTATVQLFGRIIERDGHFKFISYANQL